MPAAYVCPLSSNRRHTAPIPHVVVSLLMCCCSTMIWSVTGGDNDSLLLLSITTAPPLGTRGGNCMQSGLPSDFKAGVPGLLPLSIPRIMTWWLWSNFSFSWDLSQNFSKSLCSWLGRESSVVKCIVKCIVKYCGGLLARQSGFRYVFLVTYRSKVPYVYQGCI